MTALVPALGVVAAVAAGADATSSSERPDVVHLRNGGRLRGTIEIYEPGQPIELRLSDGATRTISPEEVASVELGSDESEGRTGEAETRKLVVHVVRNDRYPHEVQLRARLATTDVNGPYFSAKGDVSSWLCAAPCDEAVDATGEFIIEGKKPGALMRGPVSLPFSLAHVEGEHATILVKGGSRRLMAVGTTFVVLSPFLMGGSTIAFISEEKWGNPVGGVMLGAGVVAAVGGIVAIVRSRIRTEVVPGSSVSAE